ncbi:hypothetical protein [Lysobacter humi (ex Lee et al. 2017)]
MTVVLPTEALREAIAAGDWDRAHALLEHHETGLRAALEGGSAAESGARQSWVDLLAAQRALIDELRTARDEAGRALERLGRDRRGMAAYQRDGG